MCVFTAAVAALTIIGRTVRRKMRSRPQNGLRELVVAAAA
jgi:hypothetical protein